MATSHGGTKPHASEIPHWCETDSSASAECVRCLIKQHQDAIDELRALAQEHMSDEEQDDLWLLRYILSNKTAAASVPHIKNAAEWRRNNKHIIDMVRKGEEYPHEEDIEKYVATELHKEKLDGGPIFIIRSGISNPQLLMDTIPYEKVLEWFMYEREKAHQICDEATRSTGKLTKLLSVNDFHHIHLMSSRDKRFFNILSESSHLSEDLYPQLSDHNVMTNMPKLMDLIIKVVKRLLPKKTTEKIRYCPGIMSGGDISKCPYASKNIRVEDIPTFLGGTCNCPGGCCGVPNELTDRITK